MYACVRLCCWIACRESRVSLKVSKTAVSRLSALARWIVEISSLAFASQKLVSTPRNRLILFVIDCQIERGEKAECGKTLFVNRMNGSRVLEDERAVLQVGSFRDAIGLVRIRSWEREGGSLIGGRDRMCDKV